MGYKYFIGEIANYGTEKIAKNPVNVTYRAVSSKESLHESDKFENQSVSFNVS